MIERLNVPTFGREDVVFSNGVEYKNLTMESNEAEIIKLAEKVNEIIDVLNNDLRK